VVVVHVLAADELDPAVLVPTVLAPAVLAPAMAGDLELVDREDGSRVDVSLSPETLARYRRLAADWVDEVAARCRQAGAGYVRLMADDDLEQALFASWRRAGVLR
jgi:hypothetical protein